MLTVNLIYIYSDMVDSLTDCNSKEEQYQPSI